MFPVKCCGLWTLIASTNTQYIGSKLSINYNTITFTPIKKFGPINIKKNIYGSVFVQENDAKIVWSSKITYDIETGLLPRITIPSINNCTRLYLKYDIDETNTRHILDIHISWHLFFPAGEQHWTQCETQKIMCLTPQLIPPLLQDIICLMDHPSRPQTPVSQSVSQSVVRITSSELQLASPRSPQLSIKIRIRN